jgi:hypothetical protein
VQDAGAGDHVEWIGPYGQTGAPDVYALADVLLHTKVSDTCPSVVIEALACGLPVVYAESGGVPELVGDEAGVGVPTDSGWDCDVPPSAARMAEATIEALTNRAQYSQAARQRAVDKFDIGPWIGRHREVFETLANSHRPRRAAATQRADPLQLVRIHPDLAVCGEGFNVQPSGESALVVECANASVGTFIVFNGTSLRTDYGGPNRLSAIVPGRLLPDVACQVFLVTGVTESNRLTFTVRPAVVSA